METADDGGYWLNAVAVPEFKNGGRFRGDACARDCSFCARTNNKIDFHKK
ncbi:MAG: hypothetical protein ACLUKN_00320 [Bacilli bacterium]